MFYDPFSVLLFCVLRLLLHFRFLSGAPFAEALVCRRTQCHGYLVASEPLNAHLQPGSGHAVIVKIPRQPVLCDLLQDADKGGNEILTTCRIRLGQLVEDVQRRAHDLARDTRVICQGSCACTHNVLSVQYAT